MHVVLEIDGERHELWLVRDDARVTVEIGGKTFECDVTRHGSRADVSVGGRTRRVQIESHDRASIGGREVSFSIPFFAPGGAPGQHETVESGSARVKPPMPGRIASLKVKEGDRVEKGTVLAILEAMKMQNEVTAPRAGRVAKVHVKEGQAVDLASVLIDLEG